MKWVAVRLAQIIAGAAVGGAELFFERLCIGLHEAGDAVLPVIRRQPDRAARLTKAGLSPVQLRFGGPMDLMTGPRVGQALQRFAPEIVVAWMNRAARFTPPGPWVLVGRLGGYYDLKYYWRCDHLVGNTKGLAAWIAASGWPADRVHYVPNFVTDFAGMVPVARRSLGVPAGCKLVLALGRLHANKGFDILLRALPRLHGVHVLIAGEGPEREALQDLARAEGVAGRVHMPGWRHDTGNLLAASDVVVCSSRHEPLGNVVIEGWSAARPVIAAAAQGPAELIEAGVTGELVPLEDSRALAEGILSVLQDARYAAMLAQAGRARFVEDFAPAPVLSRWRDFLSGLVAR
jgi:glycosyltransferase involved in cell wall biosynthesis